MKVQAGAILCCVTLGCGSVPVRSHAITVIAAGHVAQRAEPPPAAAPEPSAAETAEPPSVSTSASIPAAVAEGHDPLAVEDGFDDEEGPSIEVTPAARLRSRTSAQLHAAMRFASPVASGDAAARELIGRLGEPSWTETPKNAPRAKRRVWVASVTERECHRLVLEPSGAVAIESAGAAEWRMLTALTDQNPCTGETKRSFLR